MEVNRSDCLAQCHLEWSVVVNNWLWDRVTDFHTPLPLSFHVGHHRELLKFSRSQFPHLSNGNNDSSSSTEFWEDQIK